MAMFEMPTKPELQAALLQHSVQTKDRIERSEDFALQMDRLTDQEIINLGFTQTEVNYMRSQCTALKYIAKYYRKEDVSGYTDDPSYFIEYFLNIRSF